MPLPLLLLLPVAAKGFALLKTGAIVVKGATIISHAPGAQALVTSAVKLGTAQFGAVATAGAGIAVAATVGALATIMESGRATIAAASQGDVDGTLRAGYKLVNDLAGCGGLTKFNVDLDGLKCSLDDLSTATSDIPEAMAEVSEKASQIIQAVRGDLPAPS